MGIYRVESRWCVTPYYQDDAVTLYLGDCREILPQLEAVDHVITDPPYSPHVHNKSRRGGSDAPPLDGSGRRARASFSRVKEFGFGAIDNGTMACCAFHFSRLARRWVLAFSDVELAPRWRSKLTRHGLEYVRTGFWRKVGGTPQFTGDRPATAFEAITICHPSGRKRWNGGGNHAFWEASGEYPVYAFPIVLNRSGSDPRLHQTQKPEPLIRELIALFTDPGDVILDSFGGSATTAAAAKVLGRRCIVIEREESHCETAAKRLEATDLDERYVRIPGKRGKQSAMDFGAA